MKTGVRVLIEDEALRDGLQNEKRIFSLEEKVALIEALVAAGLKRIQVGSFVHPRRVPQMADTDALFAALKPVEGVTYSALVLNSAGLDRALAAGVQHLSISVSASETHSRKNANKSVGEALADITPTIERALRQGIAVRAGIQSALGCGFEGAIPLSRVVEIAKIYSRIGAHEINIADSAGLGNPKQVYETVEAVRDAIRPDARISLHLHDTRGLGLANMFAGLRGGGDGLRCGGWGRRRLSLHSRATGNIATEDAVYALDSMGVKSGIDWRKLKPVTAELEEKLERRLPSRMAHMAPPPGAAN